MIQLSCPGKKTRLHDSILKGFMTFSRKTFDRTIFFTEGQLPGGLLSEYHFPGCGSLDKCLPRANGWIHVRQELVLIFFSANVRIP
jgi:hypothetical protein